MRSLINRKYGIMRIRQELYARGVDRDIIREVTEDIAEDTADALRTLIKQKYMPKLEEDADKVKSALARRGYTYVQIRDAVEEALNEE